MNTVNEERAKGPDAGLKHLTGLKELRKLDMRNTRVTPAGVEGLKKSRPEAYLFD